MSKGTVYLAGPMSSFGPEGLFNFPAFDEATAKLRDEGYTVWSPAEIDRTAGFNPETDPALTHSAYMARDLPYVCAADAVAVLPGWQDSTGSMIELGVARALGKPIHSYPTMTRIDFLAPSWHPSSHDGCVIPPEGWSCTREQGHDGPCAAIPESPPETILEEAQRLVSGSRQEAYGHPREDFTRTGVLWGGILSDHVGNDPIPPETVGLMMVALKLSREVNRPKRDNRVDAAGYLLTVELCESTP